MLLGAPVLQGDYGMQVIVRTTDGAQQLCLQVEFELQLPPVSTGSSVADQ